MLWIFKVTRWRQDRCTKISKSPTGGNGIRASSVIWTANLAQLLTMDTPTNSRNFIFGDSNWTFCKVGYPIGTLKPDIQICRHFWLGIFSVFVLFLREKKSKTVGYTRTMYSQTGKNTNWAETFVWCLLFNFKVVYQDHLTQLLPFAWDFVAKGQQLVKTTFSENCFLHIFL